MLNLAPKSCAPAMSRTASAAMHSIGSLPTGVLRVRLTMKSGLEPIALFTPPWQGLNLS